MVFSGFIDTAVEFIHSVEGSKERLAKRIEPLRSSKLAVSFDVAEDRLVFPVVVAPVVGRVGAVDSGFVSKRMSSLDLLFVRAVGVVFDFEKGNVKNCSYLPRGYSFPTPFVSKAGLEADEANASNSLIRLREEIKTAIKIIADFSPNFLFLDGSIVPQYVDKPRKESLVNEEYFSTIRLFEELFSTAEKHGCTICGCVEDSRGKRFVEILESTLFPSNGLDVALENIFDASLLDYFLEVGQRTFCFPYTKDTESHPVLKDFSPHWSKKVFSFYLKPVALDRPLRVEFLSDAKNASQNASRLASVVFSLSRFHREYAFPSVLIEADLRARLSPEEIDTVYNKIVDKISKKVKLRLRRDKRPF